MKIISIYELLGLIKDGKAPKKIKFGEVIYILNAKRTNYVEDDFTNRLLFDRDFFNFNALNDVVEIIEEEKEIEKINYYPKGKNEFQVDYYENGELKHFCLNKKQRYFADKINELSDEIQKLKKGEKHE